MASLDGGGPVMMGGSGGSRGRGGGGGGGGLMPQPVPSEGSSLASGRTPPATPKKVGGKMLAVKILMLDDTYTLFQIQVKCFI